MADEPAVPLINVTKLDAAKRQLPTAIELWFHDGDPVSIHTLVYAAHEIIHRLYRRAGHRGLLFDFDAYAVPADPDATPEEMDRLRSEFPKYLKNYANFFKHAERESQANDAILFSPEIKAEFITTCLLGIEAIGERLDYAGQAFKFWFALFRPDELTEEYRAKFLPIKHAAEWKRLYALDKRKFFRTLCRSSPRSAPSLNRSCGPYLHL